MAGTVILLLVVGGLALYIMTPEERAQKVRRLVALLVRARAKADRALPGSPAFDEMLRLRTPRLFVTRAIAAANVVVFVAALVGPGHLADPDTLVKWGANFGPRTTNGEWWRLVTAPFVHAGLVPLLVNLVGLYQPAALLERQVGPLVVAVVYLASGVLVNLVTLAIDPVSVSFGAGAAVFGIYGLVIASYVWGMVRPGPASIPGPALARLAPAAGLFVLLNVATSGPGAAVERAGVLLGFVCGVAVARGVGESKPPVQRAAALVAAAVLIVIAAALPMRGMSDVRPEIARMLEVEDRTARTYDEAVKRFRDNRLTTGDLARLIDRTIGPEIRAARERLDALRGVAHTQHALAAEAAKYLRLREESWRVRSEALRKDSTQILGTADRIERASLTVLEGIRPPER